jgi:hypothetical protein
LKKLKELALYIGIAIAIVGTAVTLPFWFPENFLPSRTWFIFFVATVFLCVFVIKMYWDHRKSVKIWKLLALIFLVHIFGYSVLLRRVPEFPDALFLLTVPLEVMLIALIVKLCLDIMPKRVKL